MTHKYAGAWTALVTPFCDDYSIDWHSLERNVCFQAEQGITGVLSMGTTGESATVTHKEHAVVTSRVIEYACGLAVLAGTGSNSTDEALYETSQAVDAGAAACLLVDCYYNKPSSLELRKEYYGVLCQKYPDTDFIAYAIPARSVTVISPEDLAIAADQFQNLVAVKEATGDFERMALTRKLCGGGFGIISGDDPNTLRMMLDDSIACCGVISVMSNIVPKAVSNLVRLSSEGKKEEAQNLERDLNPLFSVVGVTIKQEVSLPDGSLRTVRYGFPNPLPVKALMHGLGMSDSRCKRPLGRMTKEAVLMVREQALKVWDSNPGILEPVGEFYGVDVEKRLSDDSIWDGISY